MWHIDIKTNQAEDRISFCNQPVTSVTSFGVRVITRIVDLFIFGIMGGLCTFPDV